VHKLSNDKKNSLKHKKHFYKQMHTNAIIVASVGLALAIVATLFILLSDFGCITGNVGSAGLTGPLGPTGDRGSQKQVMVSTDPDLVARDLTVGTGHTQPSFVGNLLQDAGKGYMISWWMLSALSPRTTVTLNFEVMNNDTTVPLTPGGAGIALPFTLVANVRQEISVKIYIWKIDDQTFNLAIEGQIGLFTGTIINYDTANIAVRLKVNHASGYNRANAVHVYQNTQVDEVWCTG
jgi:hypothetical protein